MFHLITVIIQDNNRKEHFNAKAYCHQLYASTLLCSFVSTLPPKDGYYYQVKNVGEQLVGNNYICTNTHCTEDVQYQITII